MESSLSSNGIDVNLTIAPSLVVGTQVLRRKAARSYLNPGPEFQAIAGADAAALVDRCTINDEEVVAQPGGFYGGWISGFYGGWIIS